MSEFFDSIRITSVAPSLIEGVGLTHAEMEKSNTILLDLIKSKTESGKVDRILMYNPDAVALWLYQKYTQLFSAAAVNSDIALPMLSVMPSVTPVCFASMYTGVMPEIHGIQAYRKPILTQNTVFDEFLRQGKKCAIVSTEGDSISKIFLNRDMDYFIYETEDEVNKKAFELIEKDEYDLLVVYNGNYDSKMHKVGPEDPAAIDELKYNIETYKKLIDKVRERWKDHDALYAFAPDHGCHEVDGDSGAHGLNMDEDMNIIHFYGINPKK